MSAANLINLIRKETLKIIKNEYVGFELGTVISPSPDLVIKVDNLKVELSKQDLIICESLLTNTRIVSILSRPGTVRELGGINAVDENSIYLDNGTLNAHTDSISAHAHELESFELENAGMEMSYVELKFEESLAVGDRVLVQAVPGGQKYVIVDRVVKYG